MMWTLFAAASVGVKDDVTAAAERQSVGQTIFGSGTCKNV